MSSREAHNRFQASSDPAESIPVVLKFLQCLEVKVPDVGALLDIPQVHSRAEASTTLAQKAVVLMPSFNTTPATTEDL
jgi:hypothetical protein